MDGLCTTLGDCAYDWQTLFTGLLAIGAAWWSGRLIKSQVNQAERHERKRYQRRNDAARAILPVTLSTVCQWCVDTAESLAELHSSAAESLFGVLTDVNWNAPVIPDGLVPALERAVEAIEDQKVVDRLSAMMVNIQVLTARTRLSPDQIRSPRLRLNIDDYLIQTATIYAQASSLFAFARREEAEAPAALTWAEVRSALSILRLRDDTHPDLHSKVDRKEKLGSDPP